MFDDFGTSASDQDEILKRLVAQFGGFPGFSAGAARSASSPSSPLAGAAPDRSQAGPQAQPAPSGTAAFDEPSRPSTRPPLSFTAQPAGDAPNQGRTLSFGDGQNNGSANRAGGGLIPIPNASNDEYPGKGAVPIPPASNDARPGRGGFGEIETNPPRFVQAGPYNPNAKGDPGLTANQPAPNPNAKGDPGIFGGQPRLSPTGPTDDPAERAYQDWLNKPAPTADAAPMTRTGKILSVLGPALAGFGAGYFDRDTTAGLRLAEQQEDRRNASATQDAADTRQNWQDRGTQLRSAADLERQRRQDTQSAANTQSEIDYRTSEINKNDRPPAPKMQRAIIDDPKNPGTPLAVDFNPDSGAYMDPDTGKAIAGAKAWEKKPAADEKAQDIQDYLAAHKLEDNAANRETARTAIANRTKQPRDAASNARSDRSYSYESGVLDKISTPLGQRAEKLGTAADNLAQRTPAADALVAPEILTLMAGGQGSGLRMNEAEISRIVGGRTNWEGLKAKLNQWQADPSKGLSITEPQRAQMQKILDAARQKIESKTKIIEDARDALENSDDPKEHRRIVNDARKNLDAVDLGKSSASSKAPDGATDEVFAKDGKTLLGHIVNGQYVPLNK